MTQHEHEALVIGSGPNGLAAALVLSAAGVATHVFEAEDEPGGGARTGALTLPGFRHDVCSAVHPLAALSPYLRGLPLAAHGLRWIDPPSALAHPLGGGEAALLVRSIEGTARGLEGDARPYRELMQPLVDSWPRIDREVLGPLRVPRDPLAFARFGLLAVRPAAGLIASRFAGDRARALLAGIASHSGLPLEQSPSAGFGLVLAIAAHVAGWPIPAGGAAAVTASLVALLKERGVAVETGRRVESLEPAPPARAVLCDVTPRQMLGLAGALLPPGYRRALGRWRYGPAAYKIDWALAGPIPWTAAECGTAATVHLGGTFEEIAAAERTVAAGGHPEKPFVILAQPSRFDSSRAPEGRHVAWAYTHVPLGSDRPIWDRIESQVERFAPGFRERILARAVRPPGSIERGNANHVGGDIAGGSSSLRQVFLRPTWRHYATPRRDLWLCSSSTPPGGGVHGMCGYWAARRALGKVFGRAASPLA